ncbi:MAG: hypothetical protein ACO1HP_07495 [Bacteroidota bacterium]
MAKSSTPPGMNAGCTPCGPTLLLDWQRKGWLGETTPTENALLLEDGTNLLLEDGSNILLES